MIGGGIIKVYLSYKEYTSNEEALWKGIKHGTPQRDS